NAVRCLDFPGRGLVSLVKLQGGAANLALGAATFKLAAQHVLWPLRAPVAVAMAVAMRPVIDIRTIASAAHVPASGTATTLTARVWTLSHEYTSAVVCRLGRSGFKWQTGAAA